MDETTNCKHDSPSTETSTTRRNRYHHLKEPVTLTCRTNFLEDSRPVRTINALKINERDGRTRKIHVEEIRTVRDGPDVARRNRGDLRCNVGDKELGGGSSRSSRGHWVSKLLLIDNSNFNFSKLMSTTTWAIESQIYSVKQVSVKLSTPMLVELCVGHTSCRWNFSWQWWWWRGWTTKIERKGWRRERERHGVLVSRMTHATRRNDFSWGNSIRLSLLERVGPEWLSVFDYENVGRYKKTRTILLILQISVRHRKLMWLWVNDKIKET